ncbi:MAG TPA: hypothetical protein VHA70_07555 [Bauldia sp.]|nr:hypothetical protein [Bauldia sp.]
MALRSFAHSRTRIALVAVALISAVPAWAGPIEDNAADADARIASGDGGGAVAAFDAAAAAFFDAVPLTFRVATFADDVAGFGKYTPHAGAYHAGETATVYLEPVGYGFTRDGDDFRVSYGTGLEIRTPGGLILGKTDDFGALTWTGRARSYEVQAAVSVTLPTALKPGDYELLLTLKDEASSKSATATLPFTIAE